MAYHSDPAGNSSRTRLYLSPVSWPAQLSDHEACRIAIPTKDLASFSNFISRTPSFSSAVGTKSQIFDLPGPKTGRVSPEVEADFFVPKPGKQASLILFRFLDSVFGSFVMSSAVGDVPR